MSAVTCKMKCKKSLIIYCAYIKRYLHFVSTYCSAGVSPPIIDGSIIVQILSDHLEGSVHLTQCCSWCRDVDGDPPQERIMFVLFSGESWKQFALQVGALVKIHPPW